MQHLHLTRGVRIPDPVRISRCLRAPELGPKILFFSGGSALRGVSRVLKTFTHNSTHMVTPFDSGGSSAKLRQAFAMPSVGDLRNRLMTLADETVTGHPEVYRLFTYRFPKKGNNHRLLLRLEAMIQGHDLMVSPISNPMRRLIRTQLGYFRDAMPADFDLRGASIGNLILAGGFLHSHRRLDQIIFLFSKLVGVLGTVRPVVNDNLHLVADLEDGRQIIGQHQITGKEAPALTSPIKRLGLSKQLKKNITATSMLRKENRNLIVKSDLICYPPGSYFSSLIANLMPKGIGSAIAATNCPKIYIPNSGQDPEQFGMTLDRSVTLLLEQLRRDPTAACSNDQLLNIVLIDIQNGVYPSSLSPELVKDLGIELIDTRLVTKRSAPFYDAKLLVQALVSLT